MYNGELSECVREGVNVWQTADCATCIQMGEAAVVSACLVGWFVVLRPSNI